MSIFNMVVSPSGPRHSAVGSAWGRYSTGPALSPRLPHLQFHFDPIANANGNLVHHDHRMLSVRQAGCRFLSLADKPSGAFEDVDVVPHAAAAAASAVISRVPFVPAALGCDSVER
ncbi:MAG: hypothetical protein WBF57_28425, partial [Mycobacterium sp.]